MNLGLAARCWLIVLTLVVLPAQAQPPTAFDTAMDDYAHQRFRDAFDGLARLADGGHADAARIALLMVAHGPRLFMQHFEVTNAQRQRWLGLASAQATRAAGVTWSASSGTAEAGAVVPDQRALDARLLAPVHQPVHAQPSSGAR